LQPSLSKKVQRSRDNVIVERSLRARSEINYNYNQKGSGKRK